MRHFLTFLALLSAPTAASAHESRVQLFWVPVWPCTEYGLGASPHEKVFTGVLGGACNDRRSANGEKNRQDVTNTFFRFRLETKYALTSTVWESGWRLNATLGPETDKFRSEAGSEASVAFLVSAAHITYLFRPLLDATIELGAGYGYLHKMHAQRSFSQQESDETRGFLERNTSSNHHPGLLLNLGYIL